MWRSIYSCKHDVIHATTMYLRATGWRDSDTERWLFMKSANLFACQFPCYKVCDLFIGRYRMRQNLSASDQPHPSCINHKHVGLVFWLEGRNGEMGAAVIKQLNTLKTIFESTPSWNGSRKGHTVLCHRNRCSWWLAITVCMASLTFTT